MTPVHIPVTNKSMNIEDCRDSWHLNEAYHCWCLEDLLYTAAADVPEFQRLSIFVPEAYLNADGTINRQARCNGYRAEDAPIVFENNAAGYMQMPHTRLGEPRSYAEQYLRHGLIYVSCGCRGRESRNARGELVGKIPITLVDLKTAIRFLRHNKAVLPGDFSKLISVGWSAGGAMSALLGVSGDNPAFLPYLERNGAFMDESDAVFAAQIYCPIIDLEHADMAYEWMFRADKTCEDSPAGLAETMTPFKEALSAELAKRYAAYINALQVKHPESGVQLMLDESGRGGSFYDYLMDCLNASATDFLTRLEAGRLSKPYNVKEYLSGHPCNDEQRLAAPKPWLLWQNGKATISDLDTYVLNHRRRMKPCTSFDKLSMDSGENQAFGNALFDDVHFCPEIGEAIAAVADCFPAEAARYQTAYAECMNEGLAEQIRLINPFSFIDAGEKSNQAAHYRIRVGAADADTALSVSMLLALKLQNANCGTVDYAQVWDQPHSEADYEGELLSWIDNIVL